MLSYDSIWTDELRLSLIDEPPEQASQFTTESEFKAEELLESRGSEHFEHPETVSKTTRLHWFRWWLPELLASSLSMISFIVLVAILWSVDGRAQQNLNLPHSFSLKLNAFVALLSSISRGSLMVPIGSVMSQEVWIWLSEKKKGSNRYGQLVDLELSDAASRGSLGSLQFLFRAGRRHVHYQVFRNYTS